MATTVQPPNGHSKEREGEEVGGHESQGMSSLEKGSR